MAGQEHRRVLNQPRPAMTQADWEQVRRALLMVIAQFKSTDSDGCYTLEVRLVQRARVNVNI